MPKFLVTRKRIATQTVQLEVEAAEGESPLVLAEKIEVKESQWVTRDSMPMSSDVAPVAEEIVDGAA